MKPLTTLALLCLAAALPGPAAAAQVIPVAGPPAAAAPAAAAPAEVPPVAIPSATSSIVVTLDTTGDFERKVVHYGCEGTPAELQVDYLNAAPNYLALIPIDGATLVFNTVLSGSGARYAAGKYVWSTKGADASLFDLTAGANAKPVLTCTEMNETP